MWAKPIKENQGLTQVYFLFLDIVSNSQQRMQWPLAVFSLAVSVLAGPGKVGFPRKSPVSIILQQRIQDGSSGLTVPSVALTRASVIVIHYFPILSFLGCCRLLFQHCRVMLPVPQGSVSFTLVTSQPQAPAEPPSFHFQAAEP